MRLGAHLASRALQASSSHIGFLVNLWMIATQMVAAHEALDTSTGRAVSVCFVSFIPHLILFGSVQLILLLLF